MSSIALRNVRRGVRNRLRTRVRVRRARAGARVRVGIGVRVGVRVRVRSGPECGVGVRDGGSMTLRPLEGSMELVCAVGVR